jgi:hypothetical protein
MDTATKPIVRAFLWTSHLKKAQVRPISKKAAFWAAFFLFNFYVSGDY